MSDADSRVSVTLHITEWFPSFPSTIINTNTMIPINISSSSSTKWLKGFCSKFQTVASSHQSRRPIVVNFFGTKPLFDKKELREKGIFDANDVLMFDTLHEMRVNATVAFHNNPLFGTFKNGKYDWMSYGDWGKSVDVCRSVLKDLGVSQYSKVGIISNNRWEWATIASAAHSLNATMVPMYEAQRPEDWSYIINDSGSVVLFCATHDIYNKVVSDVLPQCPFLKATLCLDAPEDDQHAFSHHMKRMILVNTPELPPSQDDLANLIYTSGTTGKPKGCELMHSNIVSNVKGVRGMVENVHEFIRPSDRSLAFLPWAHSYGQTCELWVGIAHGGSAAISRGVPHLLEDLQLVKPSVLFAVPTLYKRVYDGVHNLIESSSPLRKNLMKKAIAAGRRNYEAKTGGSPLGIFERIQFHVLDSIVLSKIRSRFGGNLQHGFVAGAACPSEVINFMDDIGIPICEGYGLTETSPIITINTPFDRRPGFVGRSLPGVTVVIMGLDGLPLPPGQEGEICCYGPNVMKGYYKDKKATDDVISIAPDGKSRLFHTGDLGYITSDGWVKVTGRLKELYKLENGKYVCPTPIEEAIAMSRFISQVVLCGANKPYNVALIVPDWKSIRNELKINDDVTEENLVNYKTVKALIDNEVRQKCKNLKKYEVPHFWSFVAPFTSANNMLTPKMSIRRHEVIRVYQDVINSMYERDEKSVSLNDLERQERVA